jgi:HD-like signal output (HDOD) protein
MTPNNSAGTEAAKSEYQGIPEIFSDLQEKDLLELYKRSQKRKFQKGEIICENLHALSSLYIVLHGCVRLSASVNGFTHSIDFPANQIFGFLSSHHGTTLSYSLIAKDSTTLMEINTLQLKSLPEHLSNFLYTYLRRALSHTINTLLTNLSESMVSRQHFIDYIGKIEAQKSQVIASSFVSDVLAKIPKLPSYTNDLLLRLGDENSSTQEIVKKIQSDPSLGGIILKAVNSAYYGLSGKIADIYHAVVYLGFNNVYQLIIQQGINSILPNEKEFHDIQIKSSMVAILSQEIAVLSNSPSPMIATTIGLLHNIGMIVMALLKRKNPHLCEVLALFDEAAIGAKLLQNWGVPDKISAVIMHQNAPAYTPPDFVDQVYRHDIATLYIAKICCGMLLGTELPSMIFGKEYLSLLDLQAPDVTQFYRHAMVPALVKNQRKFPATIRQILGQKLGAGRTQRV